MENASNSEHIINQSPSGIDKLIEDIKEVCPETSKRFVILIHDIIYEKNFGNWETINLWDVLNPGAIEEKAFSSYRNWPGWLKIFELLRNTLILLPITLTWLGLSIATYQYRIIPVGTEGSFLYLWETGALGRLTFSELGLLDTILLGILIVLTFLVHQNKEYIQTRAMKKASELRRRVEAVIWQMEKELSTERSTQNKSQSNLNSSDAIDLVKHELIKFEKQLNQQKPDANIQAQLLSALEELKKSISNFAITSNESTKEVRTLLKESTESVNKMYDRANSSTEKLAESIINMMTKQQDFIISLDPLERYIGSVSSINNELNNALGELLKDKVDNRQDRKSLLEAVSLIKKAVGFLNDGNQKLPDALGKMTESYSKLSTELHRITSTAMRDQTDRRTSLAVWVLVAVNVISIIVMIIHNLQ